ncbi:MAG TPA: PEP-CTERM sorting domain-containing protein [Candidatus Acidoferrales bacterium]|nr:PEP-CTERM sorting domain-containing protein [Candidatus Acidoferrales bacterium]
MKSIRNLLISFGVALIFSASASATPVNITNAGFETPALGAGGFVFGVPGWTVGPGGIISSAGVFRPGASQYPGGVPEGTNVAYTKGPWLSQVLTATLQPNTIYTLTVDVGYRLDESSHPFTGFTISLLAGNTIIASSSTGTPSAGQWIAAFASATSLAGNPLLGQPLQILLTVNSPLPWQVNFDNVRLDATAIQSPQIPSSQVPEPASFALLGTGLLALIGRRRAARR